MSWAPSLSEAASLLHARQILCLNVRFACSRWVENASQANISDSWNNGRMCRCSKSVLNIGGVLGADVQLVELARRLHTIKDVTKGGAAVMMLRDGEARGGQLKPTRL